MKRIKLTLLLFIFSMAWSACNKEETIEYTNNPPVIILHNEEIIANPRQNVLISATLNDDLGVKFITLSCPALNLNRTFNISTRNEIVDHHEFTFNYRIPAAAVLGEHNMLVAPMLSPGEQGRYVYLPEGNWSSDQNEYLTGGKKHFVKVPLSRLPYFKRLANAS